MIVQLAAERCYNISMKAFETSTTVQPQGDIRVASVPFAPGTEVEVAIIAKRKSATEFAAVWHCVTAELRNLPSAESISDQDIQQEIEQFRAGQ
jgi:hypothetical protein